MRTLIETALEIACEVMLHIPYAAMPYSAFVVVLALLFTTSGLVLGLSLTAFALSVCAGVFRYRAERYLS